MIAWLASLAFAAPCPGTTSLIDEAWAAVDDAEVERALELLRQAEMSLSCQTDVVATSTITDRLYLEAMLHIARREPENAVGVVFRAVVVDPNVPPGPAFGPEVAAEYDRRRGALESDRIQVFLEGDSRAWVDGRPLTSESPLSIVAGEHLLQWRAGGSFHSQKVELHEDHRVIAGPLLGEIVETGEIVPIRKKKRKSKYRPVGIALAGATTAIGVGVLGIGGLQEVDFKKDPYANDSYGRCSQGEDCYASERQAAIQRAAGRIRATYVTGYLVTAGGVAFTATELLIMPRLSGGAEVQLSWRW